MKQCRVKKWFLEQLKRISCRLMPLYRKNSFLDVPLIDFYVMPSFKLTLIIPVLRGTQI